MLAASAAGGTAASPAAGRLAAIAEGKTVPTETHAAVAKEEPVLQVDNFNLWYGAKQALHTSRWRFRATR